MVQLEVANPVAEAAIKSIEPAARPTDLDGKRIGLYWNFKPGGNVALDRVQSRLADLLPNASFQRYQGTVGGTVKHLTPTAADQIAANSDVLVGTTGD
jgi:hypothetical protein